MFWKQWQQKHVPLVFLQVSALIFNTSIWSVHSYERQSCHHTNHFIQTHIMNNIPVHTTLRGFLPVFTIQTIKLDVDMSHFSKLFIFKVIEIQKDKDMRGIKQQYANNRYIAKTNPMWRSLTLQNTSSPVFERSWRGEACSALCQHPSLLTRLPERQTPLS